MALVFSMLLTTEPAEALFPWSAAKELHFHPSRFTVQGQPLDEKTFPGGPWFPGLRFALSAECTGYVVFDSSRVQLFVYDKQRQQMTDSRLLARFQRLEGAYERTTNSWWVDGALVTSEFLRDFEREDPSIPGTKNITGQTSSVHRFEKGKFTFVSDRLPAKRAFAIKR